MIPCSLGNGEWGGGDEKLGLNAIRRERCRNRFFRKDSIPTQGPTSTIASPSFYSAFFLSFFPGTWKAGEKR